VGAVVLSSEQRAFYDREGYLVLRGAITDDLVSRLERGFARHPPLDGTLDPNSGRYPEPGRYTLATQCAADPDLGFIIEHPTIVSAAEALLGDAARLTAFVLYDRTPGGPGIPPHHDYKRWRPVGSSMNWLFTIVPFCDYDADNGPLYLAPRSHGLTAVRAGDGPCLEVTPPAAPTPEDFIDPGLRRGDLLLMNMHLWHYAPENRSSRHRAGLFNKYAAASAPPATGYYLYEDRVLETLSPAGRRLIAAHGDRPMVTTRALLTRRRDGELQLFGRPGDAGLTLPGGPCWDERAIPDWDLGNMIAPLRQHLREQIQVETPWLTWIGDFEEAGGLCRTYAYPVNANGFRGPVDGDWVTVTDAAGEVLADPGFAFGWEREALRRWLDPTVVRGKGVAQSQARIDQFAY